MLTGADFKNVSKLFATIVLAVKAVNAVHTAANSGRFHSHASFMDPLRRLVVVCDNVMASLERLRNRFLGLTLRFTPDESAGAQEKLGKPPIRSTVNLRHFSICATVMPHPYNPAVLGSAVRVRRSPGSQE